MLGVLGGMGPAATVDFLAKFVALTPAQRDQEHLPVLTTMAPHIPDRSSAILGQGPSPLPVLLRELDKLVAGGASAIAIPCNACHHWYEALQAACPVPILHIATATMAALEPGPDPVVILATRGTLHSGFYQRQLHSAGHAWGVPDEAGQQQVDRVIALVKAGAVEEAGRVLATLWQPWASQAGQLILACTEIPLAAAALPVSALRLVDSTHELARYSVAHCLAKR
ncbi:MAG TPA: amino acid racemase [Burkholderiaceae bacterium]|uniref:aspartate/glutamate racemase family protein n=1 Tax=Curvibacter delicatus TaxID=80879 RepID=UPI00083384E8|nr:amino acid racemase [Curvibacter delicatus]HJV03539.1 amino acid racemase [Burkholderiaceae bacterium]